MIKGLTGGRHIVVDGGGTALPYTSQSTGDSFSGVIRIFGNELQYYNMGAWITLPSSYATVGLDGAADSAIKWAQDKMAMEGSERAAQAYKERRAKEHPSLYKALEAIDRAKAQRDADVNKAIEDFNILDKLIGTEQTDAGMMMPMSAPGP